jgi:hypothetical protein
MIHPVFACWTSFFAFSGVVRMTACFANGEFVREKHKSESLLGVRFRDDAVG